MSTQPAERIACVRDGELEMATSENAGSAGKALALRSAAPRRGEVHLWLADRGRFVRYPGWVGSG